MWSILGVNFKRRMLQSDAYGERHHFSTLDEVVHLSIASYLRVEAIHAGKGWGEVMCGW